MHASSSSRSRGRRARIYAGTIAGIALCCALFTSESRANDGRDRYAISTRNLFAHIYAPVAPGAGFRVLAEDMEGGADGDPSYRWAQPHAAAIIQVAAYHTVQQLGSGPHDMAVFDLSSENGDTPVTMGVAPTDKRGALAPAPRGRHPGGSHDGGLNLDLGYYMTDLRGKFMEEDYAACTNHYSATELDADGKPQDVAMCTGPADRLDVDRQAYFFLELLKLHRDRFDNQLLDQVGVDRMVFEAVRKRLVSWNSTGKHGVTRDHLRDFDAIMTSDRWGGWQRYHHHHIHVRIQNFSTTGPLRHAVLGIESEARTIRAQLGARANPTWPAAVDATLISYGLSRSIELHAMPRGDRKGKLQSVRYRMLDGEWQAPDDLRDDYRYMFDLPGGLQATDGKVRVEAELTMAGAKPKVVSLQVHLPKQDRRLFATHKTGDVTGTAIVRGSRVSAQVRYPVTLRPIVTSVTYLVHPVGGGEPERHVVYAGWFAESSRKPSATSVTRSNKAELPLALRRSTGAAPIALIEAQLMLSSRYRVTVPLYIGTK